MYILLRVQDAWRCSRVSWVSVEPWELDGGAAAVRQLQQQQQQQQQHLPHQQCAHWGDGYHTTIHSGDRIWCIQKEIRGRTKKEGGRRTEEKGGGGAEEKRTSRETKKRGGEEAAAARDLVVLVVVVLLLLLLLLVLFPALLQLLTSLSFLVGLPIYDWESLWHLLYIPKTWKFSVYKF